MTYIIILFLTGLWSCEKPQMPEPNPHVQDTIFELKWASLIDQDVNGIISTNYTQEYKDWVLVGGTWSTPPTIYAFNKVTGNKAWTYIHQGAVSNEIDISAVYENIYIGICNHGIIAVDLDKQESIWELDYYPLDYYREDSDVIFDGHLYLNIQIGGAGLDATSAAFIKVDIKTGKHEMFFEKKKKGEDLITFSPPVFWIDPDSGDTLMIFNKRPKAQKPPPQGIQNLVAINLGTKKVVWEKEDFTDFFSTNSLFPPVIYKDIVITGGDWSIYAFNVKTGEQLWKYSFDYPWSIWTKTKHLIHGDKLFVNNSQHDVTCLNPVTGALIWNNKKGGANCTRNMLYYEKEDYLVFTSWGYGSVMVLDAKNGKTIHKEHRYKGSSYKSTTVYDKDLDMFFTDTYHHVVGFKIHPPSK